ncbi:MAG: 50S ribosomal protein L12 [Candidatus Pacearchaeota archaeon]
MEYVYAALLLHKLGKEINEENLKKVISSIEVKVDEGKVKLLVSSLKDINIDEELEKSSMLAVAPTPQASSGIVKEEQKKEEKKEEASAAAEGLSSLFG